MGVVLNELERDIALTRACGVNNSSFAVFVHHLVRGHVSIRIMLIQIQRHIAHPLPRKVSSIFIMENLYHKTAKIGGYAAVAPLTDHQLLENAVHLILLPLPTGMHITL